MPAKWQNIPEATAKHPYVTPEHSQRSSYNRKALIGYGFSSVPCGGGARPWVITARSICTHRFCDKSPTRNYRGSAESEGRGSQFHLAACLPFAPQKFQEFAKFKQNLSNLTAFEQIPEIPGKFRELFGKKHAIWVCAEQNVTKSGKIDEVLQDLQKSGRLWVRSGAMVCQSCTSWKMLKNDY